MMVNENSVVPNQAAVDLVNKHGLHALSVMQVHHFMVEFEAAVRAGLQAQRSFTARADLAVLLQRHREAFRKLDESEIAKTAALLDEAIASVLDVRPVGFMHRRDISRLSNYKVTVWPSMNEVAVVPVYLRQQETDRE